MQNSKCSVRTFHCSTWPRKTAMYMLAVYNNTNIVVSRVITQPSPTSEQFGHTQYTSTLISCKIIWLNKYAWLRTSH